MHGLASRPAGCRPPTLGLLGGASGGCVQSCRSPPPRRARPRAGTPGRLAPLDRCLALYLRIPAALRLGGAPLHPPLDAAPALGPEPEADAPTVPASHVHAHTWRGRSLLLCYASGLLPARVSFCVAVVYRRREGPPALPRPPLPRGPPSPVRHRPARAKWTGRTRWSCGRGQPAAATPTR